MKLSRFSRGIIACLIAFFVLLGLGAYLSRAKHTDSLPLVQTVEAAPGRLQKSYELTGLVVCDRTNERAVYAPADLRVESVETKTGESARKDEILIRFDARETEIALISLELDIRALQGEIEALSEENDLLLRRAELRLAQAQDDFALLEEIRASGGLRAPRDLDILYLLPQGAVSVQRGQLLTRYIPFPAGKEIVFTLPSSALAPKEGTNITCDLPVYDPQTETLTVQEEQHLPIGRVTLRDDACTFTVPIDRANVWLHEGEQIALKVGFVGETEYPYVVPRGAVLWEDGAASVFRVTEKESVLGTEIILRKLAVTVLYTDDERAVLSFDPGGKLVRFAAGCTDGMTVRLW